MGQRAPAPENQTTSAADDLAVRLARMHKLGERLASVQRQTRQRLHDAGQVRIEADASYRTLGTHDPVPHR